MAHEYYDICITNVKHHESEKELVQVDIDVTKDDDNDFKYLLLTPKDIAEIARHLGLIVFDKNSSL